MYPLTFKSRGKSVRESPQPRNGKILNNSTRIELYLGSSFYLTSSIAISTTASVV